MTVSSYQPFLYIPSTLESAIAEINPQSEVPIHWCRYDHWWIGGMEEDDEVLFYW